MHYCFLLTFDSTNPASLRMRRIGAALIERGVRVSYVLNAGGKAEDMPAGADVELLPATSRAKVMAALRAALKRLRPDFVEVLNPHPQILVPLAGLGRIRVVGLWDEPPLVHDLSRAGRLAARVWNRWLTRRAWLRVVAPKFLQDEFRARGVETVYLPHVTYVPPLPDGPSPFDEPTLVYVGSFTRRGITIWCSRRRGSWRGAAAGGRR